MPKGKRTVPGAGAALAAIFGGVAVWAIFATGAAALDVPGLDNMLSGKKSSSSSTSFTELAKACESGSTSQRAACYKDAAGKAKKAADLCGTQASEAKDGDLKKNLETCQKEGRHTAAVLQCIGDGASQGSKIDDLKKLCPAKVAVKAL